MSDDELFSKICRLEAEAEQRHAAQIACDRDGPTSSQRNVNGKHGPHHTGVCQYHQEICSQLKRVRHAQRRHGFGMWAIGILVPASAVVLAAWIQYRSGSSRELDRIMRRLDEIQVQVRRN